MTAVGTAIYVLTDRAARTGPGEVVARGIPPSVLASEKAMLGGKKAKTPIIAGSISGGVVFLAWLIGFGIYFRKRYNRKQRNRAIAAGKAVPREKDLELAKEKVVIPPDPAILLGQRKPGDIAFPERERVKGAHHHHLAWSHHEAHTNSDHPSQLLTSSSPFRGQSELPVLCEVSSTNNIPSSPNATKICATGTKEENDVNEITIPTTA